MKKGYDSMMSKGAVCGMFRLFSSYSEKEKGKTKENLLCVFDEFFRFLQAV